MAEKYTCPYTIEKLIRVYERNRPVYLRDKYHQTQLRRELIYPFFCALGWPGTLELELKDSLWGERDPTPYVDKCFPHEVCRPSRTMEMNARCKVWSVLWGRIRDLRFIECYNIFRKIRLLRGSFHHPPEG